MKVNNNILLYICNLMQSVLCSTCNYELFCTLFLLMSVEGGSLFVPVFVSVVIYVIGMYRFFLCDTILFYVVCTYLYANTTL